MLTLFQDQIDTPTGPMTLLTDAEGRVRALEWSDLGARTTKLFARQYRDQSLQIVEGQAPSAVTQALKHYFAGQISALDNLPVAQGGTPFQRQVWAALRQIKAGNTCSYGDIAHAIGNPKAVRAIGLANGANPIAIIIPCHRVIGANGTLTGYGGGLNRKKWLLEHEGAM